jgi:hypothetical protein
MNNGLSLLLVHEVGAGQSCNDLSLYPFRIISGFRQMLNRASATTRNVFA